VNRFNHRTDPQHIRRGRRSVDCGPVLVCIAVALYIRRRSAGLLVCNLSKLVQRSAVVSDTSFIEPGDVPDGIPRRVPRLYCLARMQDA
jgi:hypothetical protein